MMKRTVVNQVTGEQITFLETAQETNGEHLLIEVALPPQGDGPPLHLHDEFEEEFEVVSGKLTVTLGKEQHILQQGDRRLVTLNTVHTFTNNYDEPVVFRVRLTPPSEFEQSVRIHYGLMDDGLVDAKGNPKDLAHTALILSMQNTLVAGIPLWIQRKLFKFIVNRAHKKNRYKALEKYTGKVITK
ncbi:cupin domain-containing protein [Lysinibacillus sp. 2017]|nr:cupin domain-containing protein [Lysinibacillus sp. 2017]TGN35962.1 cupin domain-containing protein [Lysinibacillus sp. S2017]